MLIVLQANGGLPLLAAALSIPPVLMSIINGIVLFLGKRHDLMPSVEAIDWVTSRKLLQVGGMLFVMQVAISIGMQADNVVIARLLGSSAVATYAVPAKLFNIVNSVLVMLSGAIWPAYADAVARGDGAWIRRTFMRISATGTIITVICAGLFVLCGEQIVTVWVGSDFHISRLLLIVFAVQCVLYAYLQPIGFLLNGLARYRIQALCAALMAPANIGLSIILVVRLGVVGAVLGSVIAQLLFQALPLSVVARRELKVLKECAWTSS
jgi:O-antigen/teichoic acid export membrane protein